MPPYGLEGIPDLLTIDDPAPGNCFAGRLTDPLLGGVYAGNLTPRVPVQLIPGALNTGAVGTAFLGRSPDGSTKAVFAVVTADGAIVQEHTLQALDGLAPSSTGGISLWRGAGMMTSMTRAIIVARNPASVRWSTIRQAECCTSASLSTTQLPR